LPITSATRFSAWAGLATSKPAINETSKIPQYAPMEKIMTNLQNEICHIAGMPTREPRHRWSFGNQNYWASLALTRPSINAERGAPKRILFTKGIGDASGLARDVTFPHW
jgi:hypothetical protein